MRFRTFLMAAAVSTAMATPALAHRMWLLPSTSTLASTGEYVTIDAAVSNDLFYPDHFPIDPAQVAVTAPDGTEAKVENPSKGRYRGTFDVAVNKPGTWKIGIERASTMGSFKVGDVQWRVGGRRGPGGPGGPGAPGGAPGAGAPGTPPRPMGEGGPEGPARAPAPSVASVAEIPANATDIKLTETISRNFVYVTAGEPTRIALTGKGLEFDPVTHPDELVQDEEGSFRFLIDGKPAAGVKVTVVPGGKKYRAAEEAQELTTGADGVLKVKWPVAGWYWLSASAEDDKPSDKRASVRRMNFTTTVEVVAP